MNFHLHFHGLSFSTPMMRQESLKYHHLRKSGFGATVQMYGALKYPAISNIIQVEEIEQEVMEACLESTSIPLTPPGIPVVLNEATNTVIAQWLIDKYRSVNY